MAKLAGKVLTARGAAANAVAAGRRQSRDLSAEPAGTFLEREDRANPSPGKLLKPLGVAGSAGQAEDIAVDWPKPPIGPQAAVGMASAARREHRRRLPADRCQGHALAPSGRLDRCAHSLSWRPRRQDLTPITRRAVEHVAVHRLLDAGHVTCGGELPEQPGPGRIDRLRLGGNGA